MATKSNRQGPEDTNQAAFNIVQRITGQVSKETENVKAKAGRIGGLKGGNARAASLTPEQRSEIAKKAAAKRWANKPNQA